MRQHAGTRVASRCRLCLCLTRASRRAQPGLHGPAAASACEFKCASGDPCGGWSKNSVYKVKA